jgi:hypothetical protein
VSLVALFCLSIVACGSASSPSEDAGGRAATGGATNTGVGGSPTGGSAPLASCRAPGSITAAPIGNPPPSPKFHPVRAAMKRATRIVEG